MKKEITYEGAVRKLEDIVSKIENDELDIDMMVNQLKEAKELIKYCKDKLTKTDEEIKQILKNYPKYFFSLIFSDGNFYRKNIYLTLRHYICFYCPIYILKLLFTVVLLNFYDR